MDVITDYSDGVSVADSVGDQSPGNFHQAYPNDAT